MRKRKTALVMLAMTVLTAIFAIVTQATSVSLSTNKQWIEGLNSSYEYITKGTYDKYGGAAANTPYWTKLSGGTRPDNSKYSPVKLIDGHKLGVLSAWYGKTVYFRPQGSAGVGIKVDIPAYSKGENTYKTAIKVLNAYPSDSGGSFYKKFIDNITNDNGFLQGFPNINIYVEQAPITSFNKVPLSYITDAEGNYIYDLVAIGVCTDSEPDISGAAAWALRDYISEGYGFLVGHDTMYGYGGVTNADYVPNKNDTSTPVYINDTSTNGHWNMNWLMGVNKRYSNARPEEANSLILNIGDYTDKSTLLGPYTDIFTESALRIAGTVPGNPETNISARCPTNYPYSTRVDGVPLQQGTIVFGGITHTNQQLAYGKVWIDFAPGQYAGREITDINNGLMGTNNFYLTTNGNFGMMQIGHIKENLTNTKIDEYRILANTIMYLSQRQQCQICQSAQSGNTEVHNVRRISSAEELLKIGKPEYSFTYPISGCYILTEDIVLPEGFTGIKSFSGHFNADSHTINVNGGAVFEPGNVFSGWALGQNPADGRENISNILGKTTGVARVEGFLNALFKTASDKDYSNYRVEITGSDGKKYDCITNLDGKYVLSNLPCEDVIMSAKVFDKTGKQITEFGNIQAVCPKELWKSSETVPLKLANEVIAAKPVPNVTVYDGRNAEFTATAISEFGLDVRWEYSAPQITNWKPISTFELGYTVSQTRKDNITQSVLKIQNTQKRYNGYNFRTIFSGNGIKANTWDVKTGSSYGLLIVKPLPHYVTPPTNVSAWSHDNISFTVHNDYYKTQKDGLKILWQYRSNDAASWQEIDESYFITKASSSVSVSSISHELAPYRSTCTLTLPDVSQNIDNYQFRAFFSYNGEDWYSEPAKAQIKTNTLICTSSPRPVDLVITNSNFATYTAEFTYTSKSIEQIPTLTWEYRDARNNLFYNAGSMYYPGTTVNMHTGPAVSTGRANEYKISTSISIAGISSGMDEGARHYWFRAIGSLNGLNANSNATDLTLKYNIDIKQGEATITALNGGKAHQFEQLKVIAPNGLRVVRVNYTPPGYDARNYMDLPYPPSGITLKRESTGYTFVSANLVPASVWQDYLRKIKYVQYNDSCEISWYTDELADNLDYDAESGSYFEFVPAQNISWWDAYSAASARFNPRLQVYGRLAEPRSIAKQNICASTAAGRSGWIGLLRDYSYSPFRWVLGAPYDYTRWNSYQPEAGKCYAYMDNGGYWRASDNVDTQVVHVVDQIDKDIYKFAENNGIVNSDMPGTDGLWYGPGSRFRDYAEGESPVPGKFGAGLMMTSDGAKAYHNLNLIAGHKYYFSAALESVGSTQSYGSLTNSVGLTSLYNSDYSPYVSVNEIFTAYRTGREFLYLDFRTTGSPSAPKLQVSNCDFIDLTQAFGAGNEPSLEFCNANMRSRIYDYYLTVNSNSSNKNGYLVEYAMDSNGFSRSNHSAYVKCFLNSTGGNVWDGRDGVRITIVQDKDNMPVGATYDLANNWVYDVEKSFGRTNKLNYKYGAKLTENPVAYFNQCLKPAAALPKIIKTDGTNNIAEIEKYFYTPQNLQLIAANTGIRYETLINGSYKILIEPIIYVKYDNKLYALTATEAALKNTRDNNRVRKLLGDITHRYLPMSMYLRTPDLGFSAYSGSTSSAVGDSTIFTNLGLYVLRFGSGAPDADSEITYRTDTDVYISCEVKTDINTQTYPGAPASVTFTVNGQSFTHNDIYLPKGGSARAYVKYHTPLNECTLNIDITSSANVTTDKRSFKAKVEKLSDKIPPDPTANDTNKGFIVPPVPSLPQNPGNAWIEWTCALENGEWVYEGHHYTAKLTTDVKTSPDKRAISAKGKELKSGYGFNMNAKAKAESNSVNITKVQSLISYFPEFNYKTYCRLLTSSGTDIFSFAPNKYSHFDRPVHFTPLWFRDGDYETLLDIRDCWTPAGELRATKTDKLTINGNLFDDWYVRRGQ